MDIKELKCPHCGRTFIYNSQSIYKLKKKGKIVYYCGYHCWLANDNRRYDFVKGRYVD